MLFSDLVDPDGLSAAVAGRHVRRQRHPTAPYEIWNYTDRAVFDRAWTPTVRELRGVVVHTPTGTVVARPYPKFFNHGEPEAAPIALDEPVEVLDKLDGSLGIVFRNAEEQRWEVATRGSFTSTQAGWATRWLGELLEQQAWRPEPGWTLLTEIVYRDNRIVLDYGDAEGLVLLGARHIDSGRLAGPLDPPCDSWPGRSAQVFAHRTLADALRAEPRDNAEGLVVRSLATGNLQKLKQADYLALHRLLTGTTARTIWEFLAVNDCAPEIAKPTHWGSYLHIDPARAREVLEVGEDWLDRIAADVPDEFHDWVRATRQGILQARDRLTAEIQDVHARAAAAAGGDARALYEATAGYAHQRAVLALARDRSIRTHVWFAIRPEHDLPFVSRSEDVA